MKTWWKKGLIAWSSIFVLIGTANAGLLVEPYLGYRFSVSGSVEKIVDGVTEDISFSNFEAGGRLGWIFSSISAGVDYNWKTPTVEFSGGSSLDSTVTNLGAFIGIHLGSRKQWIIRGKYFFMSDLTADSSATGIADGDALSGAGYGADLGYKFLDWLAINLEYSMVTYDEHNGYELKTSDLLVSLSFPFEFFGERSSRY